VLENSSSPPLPAWITKRDGRLVPFEPDKINRALFAATESLGRPNAFLARELADGILHFFAADVEGLIPTTGQVSETVIKVARELGQPAVAQAYADFEAQRTPRPVLTAGQPLPRPEAVFSFSLDSTPAAVVRSCLRAFSLQAVFSRDLVAAQADGLITLTGLETPLKMNGYVLVPGAVSHMPDQSPGLELVEVIEQARRFTGEWLAIDGPEHGLALQAATSEGLSTRFCRELDLGLRATGLSAIVNLNSATPPPWAENLAEGPLFADHRPAVSCAKRAELAASLLETLARPGVTSSRVRVDWHLGPGDFAPDTDGRLAQLARLAQETPHLAFAFDRPKKNIVLAEGLDRRHAAVLLTVGLHLPRLAELPGLPGNPELFLQKIGSLARLALSAAAQKRDYLRRHDREMGLIGRGFLLDRARLVIAPVGIEAVVRSYTGNGPCVSRPAMDFGRQIMQRLRDVVRRDGPTYQLDACLDGVCGFTLDETMSAEGERGDHHDPQIPFQRRPSALARVAGLTAWDAEAPLKGQFRAAGVWHGLADGGTAAILISESKPVPAEEAAEFLRFAWQQTEVARLCLLRSAESPTQLTLPWDRR
jgi:hypothetical protein